MYKNFIIFISLVVITISAIPWSNPMWAIAGALLNLVITQFLPPASEGWREVIFSVCVSVHRGGTPSSWRGVPHPAVGGTPSSWRGVPYPADGGYPIQLMGGTPSSWWGVPHPAGGGVPQPADGGYPGRYTPLAGVPPTRGTTPPPHQSSIACTCYAAGGMPLAFTQEDFLVYFIFTFLCYLMLINSVL